MTTYERAGGQRVADERRSGMSDSEILTRIDSLKKDLGGKIDGLTDDVQRISQDMTRWQAEFVPQRVYEADERTRAEIRKQLEDKHEDLDRKDDELGSAIADLQGEATRKDRERRRMWTALGVTIAGAAAAAVFSLVVAVATSHRDAPSIVVCVPSATQQCQGGN